MPLENKMKDSQNSVGQFRGLIFGRYWQPLVDFSRRRRKKDCSGEEHFGARPAFRQLS